VGRAEKRYGARRLPAPRAVAPGDQAGCARGGGQGPIAGTYPTTWGPFPLSLAPLALDRRTTEGGQ
jgi:hypothetical protein